MTLQAAASTPNFVMLETTMNDVSWRGEVVQEDLQQLSDCMAWRDPSPRALRRG
jgi:hypothetical protein